MTVRLSGVNEQFDRLTLGPMNAIMTLLERTSAPPNLLLGCYSILPRRCEHISIVQRQAFWLIPKQRDGSAQAFELTNGMISKLPRLGAIIGS